MSWEDILKQETLEAYLRNKGYEKVSEKYPSYSNSKPTYKNEEGNEITVSVYYPRRGGDYVLFMVKHRPTDLIVLASDAELYDAYDSSIEVITASSSEIIQEIIADFLIEETIEISDSFNYERTKMEQVRLPPREWIKWVGLI